MKTMIIITAIIIFSIVIAILANYGSKQLCTRPEWLKLVETQKQKIIELESRILWLEKIDEKCIEIVSIMEQILDPLQAKKEKK